VSRRSPLGRRAVFALGLLAAMMLAACSTSGREMKTPGPTRPPTAVRSAGTMDFTLPDAATSGELAMEHGSAFGNLAPAISWGAIPDKAKYLVLVADVPRADSGTDDNSVLWLVANIPPDSPGIQEEQAPEGDIYREWTGPTAAIGQQVRVRFRLYAVTKPLEDPGASPLEIVVRLDRQNVGKSEFVVPFTPKAAS
jgi:phosphatidylethanolamine-binding protein (PEBP) family uncharacterized protein